MKKNDVKYSDLNFCRHSATLGVIILAVSACHNTNYEKEIEPPNIVLIVSDDLGYNDLGVYGGKEVITPNLDKLAMDGVRFTDFYVSGHNCTPSRSGLLTGRYPQRNGTFENFRNQSVNFGHQYTPYEYSVSPERILGTDVKEVLLPELLKDAGYVNGIFGKWDMGQLKRYLPLQRGFDQFYGFANTGIDYYTHERYGVPSMYRNNEPTTEDKGTWCDFLFEREALRFIKESRSNPFFLYLPFFAPHGHSNFEPERQGTFPAPPEYLAMYPEENISSEVEKWRRGYLAAITCMDNSVGNVLRLIDSLGLRENTIVFFISDNGGVARYSDNSPLSGGKGTLLEGGIRVPCIISWPGKIKKGQVIDNFISSLEIFPTVLAAAGIEKPQSLILDGFNILPLLTGKENLERKEMYWESREEYAARVGDLKWIKSDRGREDGLFDLSADIGEKNDLSENQINDHTMMAEKFHTWQEKMNNAEPRGPFKDY